MKTKDVEKLVKREHVINFVPMKLKNMTEVLYVYDKDNYKLKTAFLLDIIHTLRVKCNIYQGDMEVVMEGFPLSSKILMDNYHNDYKRYIDYLIENDMIVITAPHQNGVSSTKYRLNMNLFEDNYFYFYNRHKKVVNKKIEKDLRSLTDPETSSIDLSVRHHLYKDLFKFEVDAFKAKYVLDTLLEEEKINENKRKVNTQTYEAINERCLDFTFDKHGRFHSNYTRLKKEIRSTCLIVKYNGSKEGTFEIDVKNSQPMLLLLLLKNNLTELNMEEYDTYKDHCKTGIVYDMMIRMYEMSHKGKTINRKEAKEMFYHYLFGTSKNAESRKMFKRMYPSIDRWLHKYKIEHGYKSVARNLQRLESDLIYNNIINEIKLIDPNIPIITVHDSLIVPESKADLCSNIFNKHVDQIFENL